MRRLQNGVSAVVAVSFVLFFSGLWAAASPVGTTISGQVQTLPLVSGQPTTVPNVTVQVVGTKIADITGATQADSGNYSLYIQDNPPLFLLKVTQPADFIGTVAYVPTYTLPDGGEGTTLTGYDIFTLSEDQLTSFYTSVSLTRDSSKSTLMVLTHDPTAGVGKIFGSTAIIRDSNGNNITGSYTVRYLQSLDGTNITLAASPVSTANTGTIGYLVFNLPVGAYTVSASGGNNPHGDLSYGLTFRPAFTYAGSLTVGSNPMDSVQNAQGTVNLTADLTDENQIPVSGAGVRLIDGASNFDATTDGSGAFTFTGIPYFSAGFIKASHTNYVNTYTFKNINPVFAVQPVDGAGTDTTFTIISKAMVRKIVADTGVDTDVTKGTFGGSVRDSNGNPVKNAQFVFYNENGDAVSGDSVFFFADTPDDLTVDSSLTSTSDSGGFVILNADPQKLIYFRITVPHLPVITVVDGLEVDTSPLFLASTFADSISILKLNLAITKDNLELNVGDDNPGASTIQKNDTGVVMLQFALTEDTSNEVLTLHQVTITNSGTGNPADVALVHLWYDADNSGTAGGGGDVEVGSGTLTNGKITIPDGEGINASFTKNFLVVYDFGGTAPGGATFRASIAQNSDIDSTGNNSGFGISVNGAPVPGGLKTIQTTGKHLSVDLTSWPFGTVTVGNSSTLKTFTITNFGNATVTIPSGGIVSSGNTSDFSVSLPALPVTILAGNTTTIQVTFTPGSAGDKTLTLTISSDAVENPLTITPITGTGEAAGGGGGGGGGPVGPLAAGVSALLVWWKRRKQR